MAQSVQTFENHAKIVLWGQAIVGWTAPGSPSTIRTGGDGGFVGDVLGLGAEDGRFSVDDEIGTSGFFPLIDFKNFFNTLNTSLLPLLAASLIFVENLPKALGKATAAALIFAMMAPACAAQIVFVAHAPSKTLITIAVANFFLCFLEKFLPFLNEPLNRSYLPTC